ncbi:MAG: hypothetical protein ACKVVP_24115 [Chloroflexota bacterium]
MRGQNGEARSLTARAGIVTNQGMLPTTEDLANLGMLDGWIRILVQDIEMFDRDLQALRWPPTINVCALLEGQTIGIGNDFAGWLPTIQAFAPRFKGRVQAVECANELDIWHWQPPGWDAERQEGPFRPDPRLTPAFAAGLVRSASRHLRNAGMKVIAPSVASGRWFEYLAEMTAQIGDAADWQAFHPYGKKISNHPPIDAWGELQEALDQAAALAGKPLALTELGVKVGDVGGSGAQAEYVRRLFDLAATLPPARLAFFSYFAWKDAVGIPGEGAFGLVDADGQWRAACREFQRCCGGRKPVPVIPSHPPDSRPETRRWPDFPHPQADATFQLGFSDWARLEPDLLGSPLENESSPFPGLSVQRTNRGVLIWTNVDGDVYLFENLMDGGRFVWRVGWGASVRVGG